MNKIVVISGSSSGIGKALATKFEADGHTVVGLSRSNDGLTHHFDVDITDNERINTCVDEIFNVFGRIDILINNAGVGVSGASELVDDADIRKVMEVNFFGTVNLTRACLKYMDRGSKIINISSACAIFPLPYRTYYCAAKSAVSMFSLSLRMELKPVGITVVDICPGDIKTNFTANRIKQTAQSPRYGDRPNKAAEHIDSREHKRMNLDKASNIIYRIILLKKGARYIVGGKYKFLNFFRRIVSTNTLINFTEKHFG